MWDESRFKALCMASSQAAISNNEAARRSAAIDLLVFVASEALNHQGPAEWDVASAYQHVPTLNRRAVLIKDLNDIDEIPSVGRYSKLKFYLLHAAPRTAPAFAYVKIFHGVDTSGVLDVSLLRQFRASVLEGLPEGILTSSAVPGPEKHHFRTIRSNAFLVGQGRKTW